jgi:hypothetical protein
MATPTVRPEFLVVKFGTAVTEELESVPLAFQPGSFYKGDVISEQNAG